MDLTSKNNWEKILSIQHPNKTIKIKNRKNKNKIRHNWITSGIMISCDKKESLYNMCRLDPDNLILTSEYKNYTKFLIKVITNAKITFDNIKVEQIGKKIKINYYGNILM